MGPPIFDQAQPLVAGQAAPLRTPEQRRRHGLRRWAAAGDDIAAQPRQYECLRDCGMRST